MRPGERAFHAITAAGVAAVLGITTAAAAQELRGNVAVETRVFADTPAFPEQEGAAASPSIAFQPEFLWESERGTVQLRAAPFLRLDAHDVRRSHGDIRDAGVRVLGDGWTVFGGIGKVFWGKTEANHLVDIVNQTDLVERLDGEAKLGQPMLSATLERSWGAVDVFLLPYFRERTYPGASGRLRGPYPVEEEAAYQSDRGRWHPDVAVRWSMYLGDLDMAISAFRGTSREPQFLPEMDATDHITVRPFYAIIDQVSVDAQWTRGATLWKLEALTRGGQGSRFGAVTGGLEHTFFGVGGTSSDLGVLAEVMIDGRDASAPPTVFDHDLFAGMRWALNDVADTSILGGPVVDYHTGEMLARVEAQRRISSHWIAELEVNWIANADRGSLLYGLRRDNLLTFRMLRYC